MKKMTATFNVNGFAREMLVNANALLGEVLSDDLELTGVHRSCGTGDCGACTVLVDGQAVLSCLTLAVSARDKQITTIESLSRDGQLHPLQKSFVDKNAIQCGYCTPGMILSAKALLDEIPHPKEEQVKDALAGNLCRCTGYKKILEAVLDAAGDA